MPTRKQFAIIIAIVGLVAVICFYWRAEIWEQIQDLYRIVSDREQVKAFISSFGLFAPLVFIGLQILQVIFAPVPGEATGFIGGYLFGTLPGFIYSSIGLTAGSWINFLIGRFLGERFVRRTVPSQYLDRFDRIIKRQGIVVVLILFIIPGFPKDYLCLFLGLSTIPIKVFLLMTALGRMPGTFMLSIQGAFLFERNYTMLALMAAFCLILIGLVYRYRERIYEMIEKYGNRSESKTR
jgi:uncharacterized membrane protein YdjX (TVP38/TMEM64 family)